MSKKHLLLVLLMIMAAVSVSAGTWKKHNYYLSSKIQNVYDVGDKVYYLNSGSLFQFDKATTQTVALTSMNKLSDDKISQIYYDWENRLLFIAYLNCNLDIIDNDGVVYNISNGIDEFDCKRRCLIACCCLCTEDIGLRCVLKLRMSL